MRSLIPLALLLLSGCEMPMPRKLAHQPSILLCDEVPVMASKAGFWRPRSGQPYFESRETGAVFPLMPALICRVVPATPENMQKYQVEEYLSQGPG